MGCGTSSDSTTNNSESGSFQKQLDSEKVSLKEQASVSQNESQPKPLLQTTSQPSSLTSPPTPSMPPEIKAQTVIKSTMKKKLSFITTKREKTDLKSEKKISRKTKDLSNTLLDKYTEEILRGKISLQCPPTAKIVRIFTSSTFTDTRLERNYLMEKTYPKLKEFCQDLGYEFQVVDMRWGVRDEATDDHMTTELCLKEVDLCNKLSTGPSFVTFLSHKYGYRDFPREIKATEYDTLTKAIDSEENKQLLNSWFIRDDNSDPPTYVLQPISSKLPDFMSVNEEKRLSAKNIWNDEREQMREALVSVAKKVLSPELAHRYLRSVTEAEIDRGIHNGGDRAFWFHRSIDGIEKAKASDLVRRYTECYGNDGYLSESKDLLQKLRNNKLESNLPNEHILRYPVSWSKSGIDPVAQKPHLKYIENLLGDFEKVIKESISKAIHEKEVNSLNTPLFQEVFQHNVFCQEKCQAFYGRKETFDIMEEYIRDNKNTEPLIVHGSSGSGKTSIMAMAAKKAWQAVNFPTVIIRFLGTTPDSSNIGALLLSITNQIRIVYNQNEIKSGLTLKELSEEFDQTIKLATSDRPLMVILDSLDQLDMAGGARQLFWLPKKLPEHVKMIVSTLPEAEYECFPRLQGMFTNPKCFLPVTTLSNNDVEGILTKWLESKHRKLQENQLKLILDAFNQCAIPLYLKLAFDEACRWKSYTPPECSVLKLTVREIINDLFTRIESLHGKFLVSRALGYLTLSAGGLTEAELEDILSCDDDVLNDVYTYWTPPIRRLPPLLLVRIKAELGQYFVDRGADGVRVFYWYHRQFIEAAIDKYCSNKDTTIKMNGVLADYFAGYWANGKKKPYTTKSGEMASADRYVAAQPNKLGESYNLRKLNNLPHHRLEADQKELLKSECLCNYAFIISKLKASGLRPLLDDFASANETYAGDPEIKPVCEALQLSQNSLQYNPNELPSQLIGRLKETQGLATLLEDCKKSESYFLLPNKSILTQPGGSLVYCLAYHTNDIYGLDMDKTGEYAATCAYDKTIKLFSVKSGVLLKSYDVDNDVKDPENVTFCNHDKTLVVSSDDFACGVSVQTGVTQFKVPYDSTCTMCGCGPNRSILAIFTGIMVKLYSTETGKMITAVENQDMTKAGASFSSYSPASGTEDYVAVTDNDNYRLIIFDVKNSTFLHMEYIFPEYKDDDGDMMRNTVDALVIARDQKHVLVASTDDNNILFYNMKTMEHVRTIEGTPNEYCEKYKLTVDGRFLYFPSHSEVIAYDLESGDRSIAINHPSTVEYVHSSDMNTFITTGNDRVIRIWDRSRMDGDQLTQDTEKRTSRKLVQTSNPQFTATLVKLNKSDPDYHIEVFDLQLNKVIQTHKLVGVTTNIVHMDGTKFLVHSKFSVAVIDLASSQIVRLFESILSSNTDIELFSNNTKFVVFSRGRMNLKVYDIESGSCDIIEGCGQRMDDMVINDSGTRFATYVNDSEEVLLFDLVQKKKLYVYKAAMIEGASKDDSLYINESILTADGNYFIHQHDITPVCIKKNPKSRSVSIGIVWNIEKAQVHQILQDEEYIIKWNDMDSDLTYDVCGMKMLDQTRIVSAHDDYIIRIFDYYSGTLLHRLFGHNSNIELEINNKGPLLLSYANWSEENAIRLWDKDTFECLASYCLETTAKQVNLSVDGYSVIVQQSNGLPYHFHLHGGVDNSKYKPVLNMTEDENIFVPLDTINEIVVPVGSATVDDNDADPPEPDSDDDSDDAKKDDDVDEDLNLDNLNLDDLNLDGSLDLGDDLDFSMFDDLDLDSPT